MTGSIPLPRPDASPRSRRARLARRTVHAILASLEHGELTLEEADGARRFGAATPQLPLRARVRIASAATYERILRRGGLGAGEAYVEGLWSADDLAAALRILVRNSAVVDGIHGALRGLVALRERLVHRLRRNHPAGSRRNISAHYDLGNDFYALWLDPTLTYSCAVFDPPGCTLEQAQRAKYERICRKLGLGPGDRVLEIGGGWGGFAIHAARTRGCRVVSATISREQLRLARERAREAGVAGRVEFVLEDYRSLTGRYDKLVSIEMIEAVGHQYLGRFFRACSERLAGHGAMLLQAITTHDYRLRDSVGQTDFIKRYVFPGGQLPSLGSICAAVGRTGDLRVEHLEDLSSHYARTLATWRRRFHERREAIAALGRGEAFQRLWDFYLASCEAAFAERYVGVSQILFAKPEARRPAPLAPLASAALGAAGEGAAG